jgi:hypothetical protein
MPATVMIVNVTMKFEENQSFSCPLSRTTSRQAKVAAIRRKPIQSSLRPCFLVSSV